MYLERDEDRRDDFKHTTQSLQSQSKTIIFLDESGIQQDLQREYGRSYKGKRLIDQTTGHKHSRTTIISAYGNHKLIAPMYFKGYTDTEIFNVWLEKILLPELQPSTYIVLDNAAFHKSKQTAELVKKSNCQLLYLPPYSPDLNPIEHQWTHLKNRIRDKLRNITQTFEQALAQSLVDMSR